MKSKVINVRIELKEKDFNKLKKIKGKRTWKEMLIEAVEKTETKKVKR
ncbi:MAG: hypothetical protein QXT38_03555 [Candidatus Aenigmatarchaeota archaeon]